MFMDMVLRKPSSFIVVRKLFSITLHKIECDMLLLTQRLQCSKSFALVWFAVIKKLDFFGYYYEIWLVIIAKEKLMLRLNKWILYLLIYISKFKDQ